MVKTEKKASNAPGDAYSISITSTLTVNLAGT